MKIAGLFSVESLMWPSPPRWLWHAIDHHTGTVLAYGFGRRKDAVFLQRKALREPCGLTRFYTDHWGAYTRHLDPDMHSPGKRNTQKIARKPLTLRTRITRLVRKTICFSKSTPMHDIVIGVYGNRFACGLLVLRSHLHIENTTDLQTSGFLQNEASFGNPSRSD